MYRFHSPRFNLSLNHWPNLFGVGWPISTSRSTPKHIPILWSPVCFLATPSWCTPRPRSEWRVSPNRLWVWVRCNQTETARTETNDVNTKQNNAISIIWPTTEPGRLSLIIFRYVSPELDLIQLPVSELNRPRRLLISPRDSFCFASTYSESAGRLNFQAI